MLLASNPTWICLFYGLIRRAALAVDASLQPVQILVDELKNEDVQVRLTSVRNLSVIAKSLGPERTRDELIPYLEGTA